MPLRIDLCTAQQVKDELKITTAGEDNVIPRLVSAASRFVERQTGRLYGSEVGTTKRFNGSGRKVLDVWPDLRAVTLLEIASYEGGLYQPIVGTDFYLERGTDLNVDDGWPYDRVQLGYSAALPIFPRMRGVVQITGDWGWAAVPEDIAETAILIAAAMQKRRRSGGNPDQNEQGSGRAQVITAKELPAFAKMTIASYARHTFATTSAVG